MPAQTPATTTTTLDYTIKIKDGRTKRDLGVLAVEDPLAYNTILKVPTDQGPALYRVDEVLISDGKDGARREALVYPLVEPGTRVISATPVKTAAAEEDAD